MLPIGLGKGEIGSEHSGLDCFYCNTKHSIDVKVYGRYFSFVYIPVFPLGRKLVSTCAHCKQTLEKEEFIRRYGENTFNRINYKYKAPKTHFAWLFIFAILIPFVIYNNIQNAKEDTLYIDSPLRGDLYEIKLGLWSYTLYKVSYATKDSIYFYTNKFEVNKKRKLNDDDMLKSSSFDTAHHIILSKKQIHKMLDSREVQDIVRNYK